VPNASVAISIAAPYDRSAAASSATAASRCRKATFMSIDIEYTAVKMLIEAEQQLRREGIAVWRAALNSEAPAVRAALEARRDTWRERMFFNLEVAAGLGAPAAAPSMSAIGRT
jgi:hypothetical protein